jgi:hypothetical protein
LLKQAEKGWQNSAWGAAWAVPPGAMKFSVRLCIILLVASGWFQVGLAVKRKGEGTDRLDKKAWGVRSGNSDDESMIEVDQAAGSEGAEAAEESQMISSVAEVPLVGYTGESGSSEMPPPLTFNYELASADTVQRLLLSSVRQASEAVIRAENRMIFSATSTDQRQKMYEVKRALSSFLDADTLRKGAEDLHGSGSGAGSTSPIDHVSTPSQWQLHVPKPKPGAKAKGQQRCAGCPDYVANTFGVCGSYCCNNCFAGALWAVLTYDAPRPDWLTGHGYYCEQLATAPENRDSNVDDWPDEYTFSNPFLARIFKDAIKYMNAQSRARTPTTEGSNF